VQIRKRHTCAAVAIIERMLRFLEQALYPRRCAFCGTRRLAADACICEDCLAELPWRSELLLAGMPPLHCCAALLEYAFPVDAALKALKFRHRLDYAPAFAALLAGVRSALPGDIDALLPVPLHWRRHTMRGFNQAVELCTALQGITGWPLLVNVRRVRSTPSQSALQASARSRNLRKAFAAAGAIEAQHVLIIDDVITTGATCRELAATVLAAGAGKVSALAVAHT